MTLTCTSCNTPIDPALVASGQTVHPNCWCEHGEPRGKRACALCRYKDRDPGLMALLSQHGSAFAKGPVGGGVKVARNAPPTSIRAAMNVLPKVGTQKRQILELIRTSGEVGMTDEQISTASGLDLNTVRPRRLELEEDGWIRTTGEVRKTRHGNDAQVWVSA